jgi:hypothetical protein
MRIIEFLQQCLPYGAGETAGFDEADAAKIVQAGFARYFDLVESPEPPDRTGAESTDSDLESGGEDTLESPDKGKGKKRSKKDQAPTV